MLSCSLSSSLGPERGTSAFLISDLVPQGKELAEALQVSPNLFPGGHDMMLVSWAFVDSSSCRGVSHLSAAPFILRFIEAIIDSTR